MPSMGGGTEWLGRCYCWPDPDGIQPEIELSVSSWGVVMGCRKRSVNFHRKYDSCCVGETGL